MRGLRQKKKKSAKSKKYKFLFAILKPKQIFEKNIKKKKSTKSIFFFCGSGQTDKRSLFLGFHFVMIIASIAYDKSKTRYLGKLLRRG